MNILYEYLRRHKMRVLWGTPYGVCFFMRYGVPYLVAITSDNCHNLNYCENCSTENSDLVLEGIYENNSFHYHINPDEDILEYLRGTIDKNLNPVIIKGGIDNGRLYAESWLWNYWRILTGQSEVIKVDVEEVFKDMVNYSLKKQDLFDAFHRNYYVKFLIGRKYILLK